MLSNTDMLVQLASAFYFVGAGIVLAGTGIRFLFRFILKRRDDARLLQELQDVDVKAHLGNIYLALQIIARELNIRLNLNSVNLKLADEWILPDTQKGFKEEWTSLELPPKMK